MGASWLPHAWFCLTFKRDKRFPYMVVNTNTNHPWKVGLGTNRGMSQLVLRMLKDVWKGDRILISPFLSVSPSLLPSTPTSFLSCFLSFSFSFLQSLVYGRISDSCVFSSQCILWRHKTRMCINTYSAIMLILLYYTGENPQQQTLLQSRIISNPSGILQHGRKIGQI